MDLVDKFFEALHVKLEQYHNLTTTADIWVTAYCIDTLQTLTAFLYGFAILSVYDTNCFIVFKLFNSSDS